jgi:protein-tyrosine phosphatase
LTDFTILVVCTGNIARSAMGQRLMQTALSGAPELVVTSAGTWGHEGSPMERNAAAALAETGIDEGGFRARELTAAMVRDAELVLTATREHRVAVLGHEPAALRRTFTLREFARLTEHTGAAGQDGSGYDRAQAVVRAAASARGAVRVAPEDDDVRDPYGAPMPVYRTCRDEIAAAVSTIAAGLLATPRVSPPDLKGTAP